MAKSRREKARSSATWELSGRIIVKRREMSVDYCTMGKSFKLYVGLGWTRGESNES